MKDNGTYMEGAIGKKLFLRTVPMVLGIVSMMAFNVVDMFFISKLGVKPLAALSYTFPVVFVVSGFVLGLGMGASAVVSRAIGQGDYTRVRRLSTDALLLGLLYAVIFIVIGMVFFDSIFTLLGADLAMRELIKQYMHIWFMGMAFVSVPMVGNSLIRATGDTIIPGLLMVVAILINVILDPLLIFGIGPFPRMEIAGAATATVISRGVTFVIALYLLSRKYKLLTFKTPGLKALMTSWWQVLYIGLPNAFTNIIIPLGIGVITNMLSKYGPEVVAGFGIASRIKSFAFTVIFALSTVLGPFIGQNLGAGKLCRVKHVIKIAQRFSLLWGGAIAVLLWLFAYQIAYLFTDNSAVVSTVVMYIRLVPIGYGLHGLLIITNTGLNVLRRPLHALFLNIFYIFVLSLPLMYFSARIWQVRGIFTAAVIAKIIAGTVAYYWMRRILRDEELLCKDE